MVTNVFAAKKVKFELRPLFTSNPAQLSIWFLQLSSTVAFSIIILTIII